jgi:hypothetical protein
MSTTVQASALKRTGPPPHAPAWLLPYWTPTLVSIWRCGSCLRIYHHSRRPAPLHEFRCETCSGQVVQWKRCAACRRFKHEDQFYRNGHASWLRSDCRRCHSIKVSAAESRRYHTDPAFADAMRAKKRGTRRPASTSLKDTRPAPPEVVDAPMVAPAEPLPLLENRSRQHGKARIIA